MKTEKTSPGAGGTRFKYTITVQPGDANRIKAASEMWGVAPTEAAAKLLRIGLDSDAGALDPDAEIRSIGFTLAAIADRLDRLDKLAEVTARAALKAGMAAVPLLKASGSVPETLKRLEAAVESTMEEARK